ncbi:hydroxysqualene dehydroxylase HpnE [Polaromonas sp.]|jgi:squalene-associated FAD-dependent desaturase|uniref:hydroxysqualene dehydroxylase HpnE n=1 Tax=Polaromonas sp. TaxID=1869339 RepID=UPI002C66F6C7|nr:hydroxysqualene dehydroxylase HpnE [Polaromonas sp.]HQS31828.1 hydroxysqualene dehydroxylase HpnE [Polaromonas sp.]HQS91052.1 hydroxysqualene dehydroxylase HpnE [Polaromonas sp.]
MKVAVIGAGWAGCAAAVEATRRGHAVTLFEASRTPGGRARRVEAMLGGQPLVLDNGQHILIGAYTETLRLMTDLGVDTEAALLRLPLTLQFPDGSGLKLPASRHLPAPLDAFAGILSARGWRWADKLALLRVATGWQFKGFQCASHASVADLCRGLTAHVMTQLIEPLCVSALNTPAERASGQVFLRVLRDALFAETGGSNLLLPRVDLSALLPDAALAWLAARDQSVQRGLRVQGLRRTGGQWQLRVQANAPAAGVQELFDRVVLACPPAEAARLVESADSGGVDAWLQQARALQYEALTTVYAHAPEARLGQPMLALPATAGAPAQFAFDRGQLGGPAGLLAFVISASQGDGAALTAQVLTQAAVQLGLQLQAVQTIVEKRATFACTPGLQRPGGVVAAGLLACGDYTAGPYPATLEGAVRSGLAAARALASSVPGHQSLSKT